MPESPSTARKATPYAIAVALGLAVANAPPVFVDGTAYAPDAGLNCHVERTGVLQGQQVCEFASTDSPNVPTEFACTRYDADGGCALMELAPAKSYDTPMPDGQVLRCEQVDGGYACHVVPGAGGSQDTGAGGSR